MSAGLETLKDWIMISFAPSIVLSAIATLAVYFAAWGTVTAWACTVCINYPDITVVDEISSAEVIVVAGEHDEYSFHFTPTATLRGAEVPPIDLLMNSATRRALDTAPSSSVVLIFTPTRRSTPLARIKAAPQPSGWKNLGPSTPDFMAIVDFAMQRGSPNRLEGHTSSANFFRPLLAHSDERIADIAYQELARLPYSILRQHPAAMTREVLQSRINDPRYYEWRSLYIQLLGFSRDPADRLFIRQQVAENTRLRIVKDYSAWLIALLEVDQVAGIEWVEKRIGHFDEMSLEHVMAALSITGTARPELQLRMRQAYERILAERPSMVGFVAKDLMNWNDASAIKLVGEILASDEEVGEPAQMWARSYLQNVWGKLETSPKF
jgi:hypothetical protein